MCAFVLFVADVKDAILSISFGKSCCNWEMKGRTAKSVKTDRRDPTFSVAVVSVAVSWATEGLSQSKNHDCSEAKHFSLFLNDLERIGGVSVTVGAEVQ